MVCQEFLQNDAFNWIKTSWNRRLSVGVHQKIIIAVCPISGRHYMLMMNSERFGDDKWMRDRRQLLHFVLVKDDPCSNTILGS